MPKILIAECMQEISTFNPVPSRSDDFDFLRGDEILSYHQGVETDVAGALSVFGARDDVELVPTWSARQKTSGGVLDAESFTRMSDECASIIRDRASGIDACYFCLHGAMSAENALDPEGFLLEKTREILGPSVPIVISLDLHGILTDRMLKNSNGLTMLHTYPHVDFADNGARAARLLLQILDRGVKPTVARVPIPALVRGDELITETGIYGKFIHRVQDIERKAGVLAAGMMIGNPFTDVPDLCSQPVVVTDNDPALAEREAVTLAEEFWEKRATMQPDLVTIDEAVAGAKELLGKGTVIFTDAADATSSGASGDSNAAIVGLLESGYEGTILTAIVDPPAAARAFEAGVGSTVTIPVGGALDPKRFPPLEMEVTVDMLSRGRFLFESWGNWVNSGNTAVLKTSNVTVVANSQPIHLFDRSLFLAHGQDPRNFDLVVVKSPHCQHRFFDAWAAKNFNIDFPGATSANLPRLGHTICQRPMYPLDDGVTFTPRAKVFD